jgi:hypothetical protein
MLLVSIFALPEIEEVSHEVAVSLTNQRHVNFTVTPQTCTWALMPDPIPDGDNWILQDEGPLALTFSGMIDPTADFPKLLMQATGDLIHTTNPAYLMHVDCLNAHLITNAVDRGTFILTLLPQELWTLGMGIFDMDGTIEFSFNNNQNRQVGTYSTSVLLTFTLL